ncbi:hypothetical protein EYR38_008646 [Pleurotus pulmonarius]|nr:hypothetical protein EYR38_008646 [Pleurotus pulmonarius]
MILTSYFRVGPPQALSRDPPVLLSPTTSFQSSPIQAFLVPTPDSGTPSQNRAASLSRNIQQTRGTRPSTTSLGGHRRTPLPNVFGPPSQLPLAAVPSMGTPPVAGPSGTSDSATVWLALLPFTRGKYEHPGHPSPEFKFNYSDIRALLDTLEQSGLYFMVKVPTTGAIWQTFNLEITRAAYTALVTFPSRSGAHQLVPPSSTPILWAELSWQICCLGSPSKTTASRSIESTEIPEYGFTYDALRSLDKGKNKFKNPKHDAPLYFIEPIFGNLQGPVPSLPAGSHVCFGWQVYRRANLLDEEDMLSCNDLGCQPDNVCNTSLPNHTRSHPRSDSGQDDVEDEERMPPRNRPRVHVSPEPTFPIHDEACHKVVAPRLPPPDISRASMKDVLDWQAATRALAEVDLDKYATIFAKDVPTAASAIRAVLLFQAPYDNSFAPTSFQCPEGAVLNEGLPPIKSWLYHHCDLRIGPLDGEQAVGFGPLRAVLRALLDFLDPVNGQGASWWSAKASGHLQLFIGRSTPTLASDQRHYWMAGAVAAIHTHSLLVGPDPICPFLFLTAIINDKSVFDHITLDFIRVFDYDLADRLMPWFQFQKTDIVTIRSPLGEWLRQECEIYVFGSLCRQRTTEEHIAWNREILCQALLGSDLNVFNHPRYVAFAAGFNMQLENGHCLWNEFRTRNHDIGSHKAMEFVAALYNRQVESPDSITALLHFETMDGLPTSPAALSSFQMMQYCIRRWLNGVGHPKGVRGLSVDEDEWLKHKDDPVIRSRLFLLAMTDLPLLPISPEFEITVRLSAKPFVGEWNTEASPPIHFHTCTAVVEVHITDWLRQALMEDCELDDGVSTSFDSWWHSVMILQSGLYTSL